MHQVNTTVIPISLDETQAPNWYASRRMDDKPRSIRLPQALWDRIDRDAERCKRSANKQVEAVLETYYRLNESVNLNLMAMTGARERLGEPQDLGSVDFNPADALEKSDDPFTVLSEWYESEGQEIPRDFGMRLFGGWESFSQEKKVDAIKDAKKLLDKTVKPFRQPKNSPKKKEAQKIIDDVELNIPKKKAS